MLSRPPYIKSSWRVLSNTETLALPSWMRPSAAGTARLYLAVQARTRRISSLRSISGTISMTSRDADDRSYTFPRVTRRKICTIVRSMMLQHNLVDRTPQIGSIVWQTWRVPSLRLCHCCILWHPHCFMRWHSRCCISRSTVSEDSSGWLESFGDCLGPAPLEDGHTLLEGGLASLEDGPTPQKGETSLLKNRPFP